jgi:hypothetical protein
VELVAVEDDVEFFLGVDDVPLVAVFVETSDMEVDKVDEETKVDFPCDLGVV